LQYVYNQLQVSQLAHDNKGNLIFSSVNYVMKYNIGSGKLTTIAGTGATSYNGDNQPAILTNIWAPSNLVLDSAYNIYITEWFNIVRKISVSTGIISTYAGASMCNDAPICFSCTCNGNFERGYSGSAGDGGPATLAWIRNRPTGIAMDASNNLYILDQIWVRVVSASTKIITFLSSLEPRGTVGIAVDSKNGLFYVSQSLQIVQYSTQSGSLIAKIDTDVGNDPGRLAVDNSGNLYIPDSGNNRIKLWNATTKVSTVILGTGYRGTDGDGGPASAANLWGPNTITVDESGNLYFAAYNLRAVKRKQLF
jgi:hypothetical protein